jgi:hypothetical protein
MKRQFTIFAILLVLGGCAGIQRSCSSWWAESFASDWIVVQNDYNMIPKRCWRLPSTSITNESNSDGIYWLDPHSSHLVHISGWYNRVQVNNGDWNGAAAALGIDLSRCHDGIYQ